MSTSSLRRIVVVGASLAGLRAAESLRRRGFDGELTIVGEEVHEPYDRPPLSKGFTAGEDHPDTIRLRRSSDLAATWRLGVRATGVDATRRRVLTDGGEDVPYDGLVVATGAAPRHLPGTPERAPGLHTLRTVDDAVRLRADLIPGARVVIVGGGFIGAELASTCRERGLDVTVVTPLPMMVTALGELCGPAAERARRHGVRVIEGVPVSGVRIEDRVTGVELADGSTLPTDVAVVAIGVVPATDWLSGSGAELGSGVVCDQTLAVRGMDGVVAAGDVASWPHPILGGELLRLEHWTNAVEQAAAAAGRLLDGSAKAFAPVPSFWSDQFGTRLQGVGLPGHADTVEVVDGDPAADTFVAEYRRDGALVGAVAAGSIQALLPYRRELKRTFSAASAAIPA
jgi:3-phenylpropionate/trans-cinnamate dioxygenase ferredoxin reductase subunit